MNCMYRYIYFAVYITTRIVLILYGVYSGVGLLPDEAQYWTWSQALDIGYYSKPPGIAFQIYLSQILFSWMGEDLGVRALSFLIIPASTSWIIIKSMQLVTTRISYPWMVASLYLLSPIGFFGSFMATTDGMVILISMTVVYMLLSIDKVAPQALTQRERDRKAIYGAMAIAIGLLWKWVVILFLPLLLLIAFKRDRGVCKIRKMALYTAISFLGMSLSILWNYQHDWVTVKHVENSLWSSTNEISFHEMALFTLTSTGFISWGFFLLGIYGMKCILKHSQEYPHSLRAIIYFIGSIWGTLLLFSSYTKIQGNWALIVAAPFFLFVGIGVEALFENRNISKFFRNGILYSAIGVALMTQGIAFGAHLSKQSSIVLKSPLKQGVAVSEIAQIIAHVTEEDKNRYEFILSDKYQHVAQLKRYLPKNYGPIYFMNLQHLRRNHYSLQFFETEQWLQKNGLFITIIPEREMDMIDMRVEKYLKDLSRYFQQVTYIGAFSLKTCFGVPVREVLIFSCQKYNGKPFPNQHIDLY